MTNKMLIDATHPEETRVVVKRGNQVEEFDFESAERAQLRGNIYLARVTRVEPSLQAAFVDYGGNRHGFLAFNEIHPDYYQIPVADREALLAEEASYAKEDAAKEDAEDEESNTQDAPEADASEAAEDAGEAEAVEDNGNADVAEEVPQSRPRPQRRNYKIQEVIKRRQIILVQIVKEERGNKGAALTTYLSIAGRYAVLMPNTARGGGISRKITNVADRKRLKSVAQELDVPQGMGLILRTAGANRTKTEIKRDFEHLLRLWENVRSLTLQSNAPSLVYEEGSLVKRAIRDLYTRDINEVLVAGDEGYKEAKGFMKLLMPSHAKNVKPYRDQLPLFTAFRVEDQLDAMFVPQVSLKSGGYIVINQTEALVAVDVNSGKATREHNIEDTAYKTNLEAAKEISRQLKLRDLAGLIVIDFIDMEDKKHIREVERVLKEALKNDRARIQVGRISSFGLLEMSRQRLRSGVVEGSTSVCHHCHGTGIIRSVSSVALLILRAIEEAFVGKTAHNLTVKTGTEVALYILNHKHRYLMELEDYYGVSIIIDADDMLGKSLYTLEKGEASTKKVEPRVIQIEEIADDDVPDESYDDEDEEENTSSSEASSKPEFESSEQDDQPRRRRRRRRRRGRGHSDEAGQNSDGSETSDQGEEARDLEASEAATDEASDKETSEEADRPRRRRGRRGGARRRRHQEGEGSEAKSDDAASDEAAGSDDVPADATSGSEEKETPSQGEEKAEEATEEQAPVEAAAEEKKPRRRTRTRKPTKKEAEAAEKAAEEAPAKESSSENASAKSEAKAEQDAPAASPVETVVAEPVSAEAPAPAQEQDPSKPARKGWWQRTVLGK